MQLKPPLQMQEYINKIQKLFNSNSSLFVTVWDATKKNNCIETLHKEDLDKKHNGSFQNFVQSLKDRGFHKVRLCPRKPNGTSTKPYGDDLPNNIDVSFPENEMPMKTPSHTNSNSNVVATSQNLPTYGGLNGVDVGVNMAKAEIYKSNWDNAERTIDKLEQKIETLTKEKDALKEKNTQLEFDVKEAHSKAKKHKKKSKEPKGLAGISPDTLSIIAPYLPDTIKALGINLGNKNLPQNGDAAAPQENSPLQTQIFTLLREWPDNLLKELQIIIHKYHSGDDPELIEKIREHLGIRSIEKKAANG